MAFHQKPGRRQLCHVTRAAVHVKHPLAACALKVMVVGLARWLVTCAVTRQGDLRDLTRLHQQLEVAVNRGQAQARHLGLRRRQNLLRRQRALGSVDGGADGAALAGESFHGQQGGLQNKPACYYIESAISLRNEPAVPQPATPLAPPVPGHSHATGHGHIHHQPPPTTRRLPPSLLMAGIGSRLLGAAGLLLLLWAAVLWAIGEPA